MKKIYFVLVPVLAVLVVTAVLLFTAKDNDVREDPVETPPTAETASPETAVPELTPTPAAVTPTPASTPTETPAGTTAPNKNVSVLRSYEADLDNDGYMEKIDILQESIDLGDGGDRDIEGRLRITSGEVVREVEFARKPAGMAGIFNEIQFKDMDADGNKDVFIIIPDVGSSFAINYFSIYSYAKDKMFKFSTDTDLSEMTREFTFQYNGNGLLKVENKKLNFEGTMDLSKNYGFQPEDEEYAKQYELSWIDPVPVVINDNSVLTLIEDGAGKIYIKVPLPVFGIATVDMIGVLNLYYSVDDSFVPRIQKVDMYAFTGNDMTKVGESR